MTCKGSILPQHLSVGAAALPHKAAASLARRRRKFGHAPLAILAIVICETLVFFLALKQTVGEPWLSHNYRE